MGGKKLDENLASVETPPPPIPPRRWWRRILRSPQNPRPPVPPHKYIQDDIFVIQSRETHVQSFLVFHRKVRGVWTEEKRDKFPTDISLKRLTIGSTKKLEPTLPQSRDFQEHMDGRFLTTGEKSVTMWIPEPVTPGDKYVKFKQRDTPIRQVKIDDGDVWKVKVRL